MCIFVQLAVLCIAYNEIIYWEEDIHSWYFFTEIFWIFCTVTINTQEQDIVSYRAKWWQYFNS